MSTTTISERLIALEPSLAAVVVPAHSDSFVKVQPAAESGRKFIVSGAKADAVRLLIFAESGLTRKQIAALCDCSVSRVGEVLWGLDADGVEYVAPPLKVAQ
jgi:redox-regulated HSP33 family molecular chaperone